MELARIYPLLALLLCACTTTDRSGLSLSEKQSIEAECRQEARRAVAHSPGLREQDVMLACIDDSETLATLTNAPTTQLVSQRWQMIRR